MNINLKLAASPFPVLKWCFVKVFEIIFDLNNYQSLNPVDMSRQNLVRTKFDGTRKSAEWTPLRVDVPLPKLPVPDIFYFSGTLAVTPPVYHKLEHPFRMAGEALPLINEQDEEIIAVNITECLNVLDRDNTKFSMYSGGKGFNPTKYAFRDRFGVSSLFIIPECPGRIYCWERTSDLENEFKAIVEFHRLTGIHFQEIWQSAE
jgi:hypothetical protein